MENMSIYNLVREVPKEALKPINAGLKGLSDINPMWRIEKLTQVFGACGFGWSYEIVGKEIVADDITKQKAAFVDILLYVKDQTTGDWSRPIPGTGGSSFVSQEKNGAYLSDECFKMALTDAISIAAKSLGIGADVWFAASRSKYTQAEEAQRAEAPKPEPKVEHINPVQTVMCECCGNPIEAYKASGIEDVSMKLYENDRHEILNENEREQVKEDIFNWIIEKL